ncbi:MAG: ArsR/SmtB family transcription factor [Bacteroidota bacterium]
MILERTLNIEKLEKASFILKALAHPTRIEIVNILKEQGTLTVSEICYALDNMDQSLVSHHLSNMKSKGILECKRKGRHIFYSLRMHEVLTVLECMERCEI